MVPDLTLAAWLPASSRTLYSVLRTLCSSGCGLVSLIKSGVLDDAERSESALLAAERPYVRTEAGSL